MTDIARLGLSVDTKPVDSATTSLKNFQKVSASTESSVKRNLNGLQTGFTKLAVPVKALPAQIQKTAAPMKNFGNQARQISLQLSQVAQQGSVTGNYFQALAIQLPDLLLGFGTFGILIGAAAGALGGPLINALSGSTKEMKEFDDAIEEVLGSLQSVRLEKTIGTIDTLTDRIKENEKELSRLSDQTFAKIGGRATSNARRLELQAANQEKINELEKDQARNIEALTTLEKRRDEIASEDEVEQQEKINKLLQEELRLQTDIANVEGQFDPSVSAANAFERRNQIIQDANEAGQIDQEKYDSLRIKNAQKLSDDLIAIEKRTQAESGALLTAQQEKTLGYTGQFFGNLAALAKEGGEGQFNDYKNLASAQAGISAALAVASVLGDPTLPTPVKIPLAVSIGALAAVQIAKIQGQEYTSSRASGGQATGRVLVGENGPEVLNLGSSTGYVSSNAESKGMMGGGNITQVFQISAGVQGTVEAEIKRAIPLIRKVAVQSVTQEARKGGSLSRAVGAR